MAESYEKREVPFYVRVPDVDDFKYITRDLGITVAKIAGRKWAGFGNWDKIVRFISKIVDISFSCFSPSCSDIYLIGTKKWSGLKNLYGFLDSELLF